MTGSNSILEDQVRMARWVKASTGLDGFWECAPMWTADSGRCQVEGQLLVWTVSGQLLTVSPLAAAVAAPLDGRVRLAELVDDLADAAQLPVDAARVAVASMAVELQAWGAIEGVRLAEMPDGAAPAEPHSEVPRELVRPDPETGKDVRVVIQMVDGNRVTTVHLPDGSRRVTSEFTISSEGHEAAEAAEALAAAVLSGERSVAELVPPDSCLGAKLRDGDHIDLVSIRCVDGQVRSVRCHDQRVSAELKVRAGNRLVTTGGRGPVEAFVVTPLEGDGPVRIYDGRGNRRGRPRSAREAVDVVEQVLGERVAGGRGHPAGGVPLSVVLVHRGAEGVLVHPDLLARPRVARELIASGWTPTWGAALVHRGGVVSVPSGWDVGDLPAPLVVSALGLGEETPLVKIITTLASGDGGLAKTVALQRLVEIAERVGSRSPLLNDDSWRRLSSIAGNRV